VKRIDRPPLVIYAERRLALALVGLYLFGIGFVLLFIIPQVTFIWLSAIPFGIYAVLLLFHRRDFMIDRSQGTLTVLHQGLFRSRKKSTYAIQDLEVRITSVPDPHSASVRNAYRSWIFEHGEPVEFLAHGRDLGMVQEFTQGFARDLGRPCQTVEARS